MRTAALILLLLLPLASAAGAEPTIVSHGADSVSVTIYRDPYRWPGRGIEPDDETLGGYALITETRTVDLPKGAVTIRFEGVASGIQPETSIVADADIGEKNQDRQLLSQRAMIDAFTGQRVLLRRTDRATGKAIVEPARIISGANGVIVQTAAGFEALQCTGLAETILFPGIPQGVSPRPVLSVTTGEQPGGRRTLTLSYLSYNFDWQANYVGDLSADATRVDLFAWVTLASRDDTSFERASTQAIAGQVARAPGWQQRPDGDPSAGRVYAQCWPDAMIRGHDSGIPPPPPPPPAAAIEVLSAEDIAVTGVALRRNAVQEQLGDLKLYRIPFPVTVAARSQKQVAFLAKRAVRAELLYRSEFGGGDEDPHMLLRIRNRKADGLGDPLPAGQVALFQRAAGQRLLLGESSTPDKAVGEEVELVFGEAANVTVDDDERDSGANWSAHRLTVSNANPFPIVYEARFINDPEIRYEKFDGAVTRRNGRWIWRTAVPADGKATLGFRETGLDG
jgi:hypothetical protein